MNRTAPHAALRVDRARLWRNIHETARFGGTPEGGVARLALSEEDRGVRDWLAGELRALAAEVRIDRMGNMFGVLPGTEPGLAPIGLGSHLDTQPAGGKFDGVLGVLAALEVARALQANAISLRHGLALVNWTNEEGARFAPAMIASGVYARAFSCADAHASVDRDGVSLGEALRRIGYAGDVPPGAPQLSAYLELHIEQGPVLEDEHFDLGIVTGVQGMRWFDVSVAGVSCHAGTTPMATRRDPVRVAAAAVRALLELADTDPGRALVTIGVIETPLGARNTVPGKVRFTVDVRHPETAGLERLEASLRDILANLAAATACGVEIASVWASPPVRFDAVLIGCVEHAVEALGLRGRRIVSGAGHDAVYTARVVPTAMIFTPCRGGISHHPTESITQDEAGNGADALLQAVLEADLALA